ncbi:MAG: hypothetical protein JWN65_2711 [Solirubrobacterales bacterium]|nr:hypothetical protein [Solirubrobacterales bacterium]
MSTTEDSWESMMQAEDPGPIAMTAPRSVHLSGGTSGPPPRTIHTAATLAQEMGVSTRTIRRAIEEGELCASRRAGRWVMTVEDVQCWAKTGARRRETGTGSRRSPGIAPRRSLATAFGAPEAAGRHRVSS